MTTDTVEPDTAAPEILGVMIPEGFFGIDSEVTVAIAVYANADNYSLVAGTVGGYEITGLTKANDGLYHATFTVTENGPAFAPGQAIPVNLILSDSHGNNAPAYTSPIVLDYGLIDTVRPTVVSATVEGDRIVLAYGEDMNLWESGDVLENRFSVKVDGVDVAIAVREVGPDGNSIILTLTSSVRHGQSVTVSYQDPNPDMDGDGIKDRGGNDSLGFSDVSVTNMTPDFDKPVITGVSIPDTPMALGDVVTVTITVEPDQDTYALGSGSFVGPYEITDLVKVDDTTYTATFTVTDEAGSIPAGDDIPIGISLIDSALNESLRYDAPISQGGDPVDVLPPALEGATINKGVLTLSFTEALDAANLPDPGAFEVHVGERAVPVLGTMPTADGKSLILLLATPASKGQTVTVTYRDPSSGNDAASFMGVPVLNVTQNEVIGGVEVEREVVPNPDGSSDVRFKVPAVPSGGPDQGGSPGRTNIDLAGEDGRSGFRAELPRGAGMEGWVMDDEWMKSQAKEAVLEAIRRVEEDMARISQANRDAAAAAAQRAEEVLREKLGDTLALRLSGKPQDRVVISQPREPGPIPKAPGAILLDVHDLDPNTTVEVHDAGFVAIFGEANFVGGNGRQYVQGDSSRQSIVFGADDDTIHGGGGDDYIGSRGGDDWLYGDEGNDTVNGGSGHDHLYGGTGVDSLIGSSGSDTLFGGSGKDVLKGGTGTDKLYGESGSDRLYGNTGRDYLKGGSGSDKLWGRSGNDRLYGDTGNDRLWGGSGHDKLRGGEGNDRLLGSSGNDSLKGNEGRDKLIGGSGHDTLNGGDGNDVLWGSSGDDAFVFNSELGKDNVDTIKDFDPTEDRIVLENSVLKGIGGNGGLDFNLFQVGSQALEADDRIIYDQASGKLYYDADGAGGTEQVQFARIDKWLSLTYRDFQII